MAVPIKEMLIDCAGCGGLLLTGPPEPGFIKVCTFCTWNPDRAVMLSLAMRNELIAMNLQRREKRNATR